MASKVKSLRVQVGATNTLTKAKTVNHIKNINALRAFTVPDPIVSKAFTKENVIVKNKAPSSQNMELLIVPVSGLLESIYTILLYQNSGKLS